MRFWDAVASCLSHYAVFAGRAGRHEFWWFAGFSGLALLGLAVAAAEMPAFVPAAQALALGLIVPLAAVTVRRLHDTGRSGALAFLVLVPAIGAVALAILLSRRGEAGENRFGDDPRYTIFAIAG